MAATDSQLSICNNALSLLKSGLTITNFTTDLTQAAKACRQFYVLARDEALGDFPWNFCTATAALENPTSNPTTKWAFSYTYPSDCLMLRRILSIVQTPTVDPSSTVADDSLLTLSSPKQDTAQTAVPFEIQAGLVYTDMENAVAEYTFRNTDETTWPAKFVVGFSFLLASCLAPRLTDGDPWNLTEKLAQRATMKLQEARAHSVNERMFVQPDSEFTRER